jgi:predicted translin family RNA/ssDNA-binding protein
MTDHDLEQIRELIRSELADTRGDIKELRTDLNGLKAKVDSWPDLHFLQAAAQRQQREVNEAREHRRYIEIKLGEIYGAMATSSEITKLREEVSSSIALPVFGRLGFKPQ